MSLVEKWRQESAEWQSMNPLVAGAYAGCARDMESACTPRPPKAEWFGAPFDTDGKPTGKWDRWVVAVVTRRNGYENIGWFVHSDRLFFTQCDAVIPVSRSGYPSPVGWSVVGG